MRALARGFSHPFLDQLKKGSESLGAQEREQERELATKIPPYVSLSVVRAWLRLWRLLRGSVQMEFTLSLLCAQQVGKKLTMARGPIPHFLLLDVRPLHVWDSHRAPWEAHPCVLWMTQQAPPTAHLP